MNGGSLFNPAGALPWLDGSTPVFVEVGADPSSGSGLDLPPGSVARFGSSWYWKFDTAATDWIANPFTTSGSSNTVATWALTNDRYFILDYDAGDDANVGYIDAAPGSTFTAAQTAAVAIKTVEQLYALVPQVGNGRSFVILQKNRAAGASYLDKDGVTVSSVDTSRWLGYRTFLWRGSTDLSNDATDRVTCGFITATAGPNGDGSFTVDAGPTTTVIPVVGGGLTVDASVQYRLRVVAGARAGQCRVVTANSATAFTLGNATSGGAVAAGDTVIIERPGVRMNQCNFDTRALGVAAASGPAPQLVGLAFTTTALFGIHVVGYQPTLVGCEQTAATSTIAIFVNYPIRPQITDSYTTEAGASGTVGMGLRYQCASTLAGVGVFHAACVGAMNRGANHSLTMPGAGGFGSRSYFGGQWSIRGALVGTIADPPGTLSGVAVFGDSNTANAQPRVTGHTSSTTPFTIIQFPIDLWRLNFENFALAAHGCIYVKDCFGGAMSVDGCTGDGTGPYGFDSDQSAAVNFSLGAQIANTVTGTSGDVRLSGNAVAPWTTFTKTNIVDSAGNNYQGTAGRIVGQCALTTCRAADGMSVGSLGHFVSNGFNASARNDDVAAAQCDGVAVMTAGLDALMYVATPASGGTPYVLSETVVIGGMAYVGTYSGGNATANSNACAAGEYQCAIGRWVDGADAASGHVAFNPDGMPAFVDVIAMGAGSIGVGSSFTIPDGMSAQAAFRLEGAALADGDNCNLAVAGGGDVQVALVKVGTADDGVVTTQWTNAAAHALTLRIKWRFV